MFNFLVSTAVFLTFETSLLACEPNEKKKPVPLGSMFKDNAHFTDEKGIPVQEKLHNDKGKETINYDDKAEESEHSSSTSAVSSTDSSEIVSFRRHLSSWQQEDSQTHSSSSSSNDETDFFAALPDEVKPFVAQHLSLEDINSLLKVSHGGNSFDFPWVWHEVAKRFLTDCRKESPTSENVIRQNVIRQYCRVQLHAKFLFDREKFQQLTLKYERDDLNREAPFKTWWRYFDKYHSYFNTGQSEQNFVHWYVQRIKEYGCFEERIGMKLKNLPDDEKCYIDWELGRVRLKKENGEIFLWDRSFNKNPTPEQATEMLKLNEKLVAENDFDAIVRQYEGRMFGL